MISPKICHCIHYKICQNMSLYPLSNTLDTKYVTVSNTWAIKDTVTSYLTKYTLCSVELHKRIGQSTSTGYNCTKGLGREGTTAQKSWAGLTEHLSVWLSQPINGSSAENVMIHCIGREIQCGLQITRTRYTMQILR